jgi:uncharacterized protein (DUF2384 family)
MVPQIRPETGDIAAMIGFVLGRVTTVIDDRDESLRGLGTPIGAMNFATPISLPGNPDGVHSVLYVLGQMRHGIW